MITRKSNAVYQWWQGWALNDTWVVGDDGNFISMTSTGSMSGTENNRRCPVFIPTIFTGINCKGNNGDPAVDLTITLRKNGSDQALVLIMPFGFSGVSTVTGSVPFVTGSDKASFEVAYPLATGSTLVQGGGVRGRSL